MTIYRVSVGNREYQVEVAGNRLRVDGEQIQANLTALNELGLYILHQGNMLREMHFSNKGSNIFTALAEGRHLVAQVERQNGKARPKKSALSQSDVSAPMPGMVKEGDRVEKGQAVVVMESMKMQMELRAPAAGEVTKISVQPNTQVEKGTVLVKIKA